jgi:anti-sigma factor RsiW
LELVHRVLDRDLMDAALHLKLEEHLATCAACREARDELTEIQRELRGLPEVPLPDAALRQVWAETIEAEAPRRRFAGWGLDWRGAAAAAVLALALFGLGRSFQPEQTDPQELARAETEARMVLELASSALSKTERVAVEGVLAGEISPALQRLPLRLRVKTSKER